MTKIRLTNFRIIFMVLGELLRKKILKGFKPWLGIGEGFTTYMEHFLYFEVKQENTKEL